MLELKGVMIRKMYTIVTHFAKHLFSKGLTIEVKIASAVLIQNGFIIYLLYLLSEI